MSPVHALRNSCTAAPPIPPALPSAVLLFYSGGGDWSRTSSTSYKDVQAFKAEEGRVFQRFCGHFRHVMRDTL
jgi:hypothetical protein